MNPRTTAAITVHHVIDQGRSLDAALERALLRHPPADTDRALVQEMSYGALRRYGELDATLKLLLDKPLRRKDHDVRALLLIGLYQLGYMRTPAHAAVAESVNAAGELAKPWAKGLINAILRGYQRDSTALTEAALADPVAMHNHPAWLLERIRDAWPDDWRRIISANNAPPPMVLRVNQLRITRRDYLDRLAQAGHTATPYPSTAAAISLAQPLPVARLPGFAEGLVSVQDAAAQFAAELLDLRAAQRILDACAAPGGKTGHILELADPQARVVALDIDAERLTRVTENLTRLQLRADLVTGDACAPQTWWDGKAFDRILVDAPCSGTGVIRRHPDIKWLRRAADVNKLRAIQAKIIRALWPLLARRGKLVYATCSILPEENDKQILQFLADHEDAVADEVMIPVGHTQKAGCQLLPGDNDMDGFYYACITKR